jgi:hypothetical protein
MGRIVRMELGKGVLLVVVVVRRGKVYEVDLQDVNITFLTFKLTAAWRLRTCTSIRREMTMDGY